MKTPRRQIILRSMVILIVVLCIGIAFQMLCPQTAIAELESDASIQQTAPASPQHEQQSMDYWSMVFVFMLATFIGIGVVGRVSRLLHTPLMSITNAISAIAVVGSIIVTGSEHPLSIRILGAIALFASMTNIVSGFLITDRMLKMFKTEKRPQ